LTDMDMEKQSNKTRGKLELAFEFAGFTAVGAWVGYVIDVYMYVGANPLEGALIWAILWGVYFIGREVLRSVVRDIRRGMPR